MRGNSLLSAMFAALLLAALAAARPAQAAPFDSWTALVVAGDWHAHSGAPSEVFDNARRDVVKALEGIGFTGGHIEQFSVRPDLDTATAPELTDPPKIYAGFKKRARDALGGCLVYFTSHGSPEGVWVNDQFMTPQNMAQLVNDSCGDRMAVVIVAACYSGVFVPVLRGDNRMVLTAARPDRPSFGCGETNMYTYFDQCFLESMPLSHDFPGLGHNVQDCVHKREVAEGIPDTAASEPQLSIGSVVGRALASYPFAVN